MSAQEGATEAGQVHLNEEDLAYLMNLLRNATQPVSTQQLIDALRRQSSQLHTATESPGETSAATAT